MTKIVDPKLASMAPQRETCAERVLTEHLGFCGHRVAPGIEPSIDDERVRELPGHLRDYLD